MFFLQKGCFNFKCVEDLVALEQNCTKFRILKEQVGAFRLLMKNIISLSSSCIMRGSRCKEANRSL